MIIYIQGDGDIEDWYNGLVPEKVVFEWINGSEADYKRYKNKISYLEFLSLLQEQSDLNLNHV